MSTIAGLLCFIAVYLIIIIISAQLSAIRKELATRRTPEHKP